MRRRSAGVQEFHFLPLNSSFAAAAPESKFTAGTAADTGLPVFICVCGWSDPAHDARHVWGGSFVAAEATATDTSASTGEASGSGGADSSSSSSDSVILDGDEQPPLQRQEVYTYEHHSGTVLPAITTMSVLQCCVMARCSSCSVVDVVTWIASAFA
jgi:hypothetical protein